MRRRSLPFILTEFAHAMGNGPGGLVEYRDLMERHSRIAGGFIWEWIDHGITQHTPDGRRHFAYGGDFDEPIHDGEFVIDGLVFADRMPSPGLIETKKVYEPFRVSFVEGRIGVRNLYTFIDSSGFRLFWRWEREGVEVASGALDLPIVAAGEEVDVSQPPVPDGAGEAAFTVSIVHAHDVDWAPAGHEVAWGQLVVTEDRAPARVPASDAALTALGGSRVRSRTGSLMLGDATFNPWSGALESVGDIRFTSSPTIDLWRAPTNNDVALDARGNALGQVTVWRHAGLDAMEFSPRDVVSDGERTLSVTGWLGARGFAHGLVTQFDWSVDDHGAIRLNATATPEGDWLTRWPRAGVRFSVSSEFDRVRWYGYGPGEGYPDTRSALRLGRYQSSVADLQTPYVIPQENGARPDARWLELSNPTTHAGLRIDALDPVGFTARPWTSENLEAARRITELVPGPDTVVTVDAALDGIGTESCGPGVLEQYQLWPRPFEVRVRFARI